ncbi:MAG: aminoglycoside phosphotransferase family protein [Actinomycetota bacterium]|nr:aminoglycoside phosphotransferase family protein [Actinomycetota bacterium]
MSSEGNNQRQLDGAGLRASDVSLVSRSLAALGRECRYRLLKRLSGGVSGAQVLLLELEGERAVLKVTEDRGWRQRALRELRVYSELAPALGIALPTVAALHSDDQAVRILMAEHQPFPPAPAVGVAAWDELAEQLGRLHRPGALSLAWLGHRSWPPPDRIADAVRQWDRLGFGVLARRAAGLLDDLQGSDAGLAVVVTHGDCHVGNLLHSSTGSTLWADWQEVCLSGGPDDLVFLWQRAEFDGASPPRDAMAAAYGNARNLGQDTDFGRALAASELRLLLVEWPEYVSYGTDTQRRIMAQRLTDLTDWLISP